MHLTHQVEGRPACVASREDRKRFAHVFQHLQVCMENGSWERETIEAAKDCAHFSCSGRWSCAETLGCVDGERCARRSAAQRLDQKRSGIIVGHVLAGTMLTQTRFSKNTVMSLRFMVRAGASPGEVHKAPR